MTLTQEFDGAENDLLLTHQQHSIWSRLESANHAFVVQLLLSNYHYSLAFRDTLQEYCSTEQDSDVIAGLAEILKAENEPYDHRTMYRELLISLDIDESYISTGRISDSAASYLDGLKAYDPSGSDIEQLCFLAYFRLGCELLPGIFYGAVLSWFDSHSSPTADTSFIRLHAENDQKTVSVGGFGLNTHADIFSRPIAGRLKATGKNGLEEAKKAMHIAERLRTKMLISAIDYAAAS